MKLLIILLKKKHIYHLISLLRLIDHLFLNHLPHCHSFIVFFQQSTLDNPFMTGKVNTSDMIKCFLATVCYRQFFLLPQLKCNPQRRSPKSVKQRKSKRFTNLKNHLHSCAKDYYEQVYIDHLCSAEKRFDKFCSTSQCD